MGLGLTGKLGIASVSASSVVCDTTWVLGLEGGGLVSLNLIKYFLFHVGVAHKLHHQHYTRTLPNESMYCETIQSGQVMF